MAASKSASRRAAAKKASKTRKSRAATPKASKTRKQRATGKKVAAARKRPPPAKKAVATRKPKAAGATRAKTTAAATNTDMKQPLMAKVLPSLAAIDDRIAIAEGNLRDLVEQATSSSGAANENVMSQRIAEQETKLALLRKQREELDRKGS